MAGTALEQITKLYESLSSFSKQKAEAMQGGSYPGFGTIVGTLDSSELNTLSNSLNIGAADFAAGTAADAANLLSAASREYTMRVRSKAEYYANAYTEFTDESNYYDSRKYMMAGVLSGKTGQL